MVSACPFAFVRFEVHTQCERNSIATLHIEKHAAFFFTIEKSLLKGIDSENTEAVILKAMKKDCHIHDGI